MCMCLFLHSFFGNLEKCYSRFFVLIVIVVVIEIPLPFLFLLNQFIIVSLFLLVAVNVIS